MGDTFLSIGKVSKKGKKKKKRKTMEKFSISEYHIL